MEGVFGFAIIVVLALLDPALRAAIFSGIVFLFHLGEVAAAVAVIYYIYKKRDTIAHWYYSLTPHPAAHMVRSTIAGGGEIDGDAFRQILQPLPGNAIEQQVRKEQAAKLAELARQSNAELRRKAEELRRRVQEAAALQAANRDLHDAVIEQQLAKAEADALSEVEGFLKGVDKHD